MTYLLFLIGLALPTLTGWLLLRLIEGKNAVLFPVERVVAGFVLGTLILPFAWFLVEVSGLGNLGLMSLLTTQLALLALLGALYLRSKKSFGPPPVAAPNAPWQLWQKVVGGLLGVWFAVKSIAAWVLLIGPAYYDDTVKNWNLRGKMFYVQKELVLEVVPGEGVGVGSYPPTVPLVKTWLATISGEWSEWIVNAVHLLWFFAALALLYFALRRLMSSAWSLLGVYLLSSLPLYLMHGSAAYADQLLSLCIFIAVTWLFLAMQSKGTTRESFLRISAIATGLMVFTKNEALILYLPPMGLFVGLLLVTHWLTTREKKVAALWYGVSVALVTVPWLAFKWVNQLTFGNAKSVGGMLQLEWHEKVLTTIYINTFFMGHWLLLPALFVLTLLLCRKTAFRSPLVVCAGYFLLLWLAQVPLYLFTGLHVEATNQTGYTRGVLHIIPLAVLVTTVCLHAKISKASNSISQNEA